MSVEKPRHYLKSEGQRNRASAPLFERLVKLAYGIGNDVIVGHHINFEMHGDLATEDEIPAADTLLFCHDLMTAVFGDRAKDVMLHLASVPASERDSLAAEYLDDHIRTAPLRAEREAMPTPAGNYQDGPNAEALAAARAFFGARP